MVRTYLRNTDGLDTGDDRLAQCWVTNLTSLRWTLGGVEQRGKNDEGGDLNQLMSLGAGISILLCKPGDSVLLPSLGPLTPSLVLRMTNTSILLFITRCTKIR